MSARLVLSVLRRLSPWGWVAAAALVAVVALILIDALGFRWDPLDLQRRRADRAVEAAVVARAESAARAAEAEGQTGQVARVERAARTARALGAVTHHSTLEAEAADDADHLLPPDRVARLRDHDGELCRIAPDFVGCAAAPDPARTGEPSM